MEFTKVPWEAHTEKLMQGEYHIAGRAPEVFSGEQRVCKVDRHSFSSAKDAAAESVANLIAAAPDLYAALERIMDYAHTGASVKDIMPSEQPQFIAAYAALAKARGE